MVLSYTFSYLLWFLPWVPIMWWQLNDCQHYRYCLKNNLWFLKISYIYWAEWHCRDLAPCVLLPTSENQSLESKWSMPLMGKCSTLQKGNSVLLGYMLKSSQQLLSYIFTDTVIHNAYFLWKIKPSSNNSAPLVGALLVAHMTTWHEFLNAIQSSTISRRQLQFKYYNIQLILLSNIYD